MSICSQCGRSLSGVSNHICGITTNGVTAGGRGGWGNPICDHQWFKLKDMLARRSTQGELILFNPKDAVDMDVDYKNFDIPGILIKCANCNEQKELWENES